MAYTLQEQYDAVNYTPEAQVAKTWGMGPRTYDYITIHWWGNPVGQTLYSIIAWFCGLLPVTAQTSAHYVISGKIAACIVSIQNAAWHAGGAKLGKHGNVCSIGLELDPKADNETYETAGEVIADIWIQIGKVIPLVGHNYWTSTSCPGSYDLARLTAIANKWYAAKTKTTPAPIKPPVVKPVVKPVAPKTINQLADETIAGKHGNGDQRVKSLGKNYNAVQAEINRRAGIKPAQVVNIGDLATRAIRGEFGDGAERQRRLGANYAAVQAEINRRYS